MGINAKIKIYILKQNLLTRSWHSWSDRDGKGHSWKWEAVHQWLHGISGKCTCPSPWLSLDYGTVGKGAFERERSEDKHNDKKNASWKFTDIQTHTFASVFCVEKWLSKTCKYEQSSATDKPNQLFFYNLEQGHDHCLSMVSYGKISVERTCSKNGLCAEHSHRSQTSPCMLSHSQQRRGIPASILHKSNVRQYLLTDVTAEAFWMPAIVHSFNYTTNNELPCK